jgi:hypothetical protein
MTINLDLQNFMSGCPENFTTAAISAWLSFAGQRVEVD